MESSTGVKVVEVCKVAPPPSAAAAEFSLSLSFYDLFWLRFPPTQRLFFYELSQNPATFYESTLPRLKESLSSTLEHYLPLAGNLVWEPEWDKPVLRFSPGNSVSLTIAESQADFHYSSADGFRKYEESYQLLPDLPATDTKVPIIALQVTLFPISGFSIGYTSHHAALDGKTLTMFMHSWAYICRNGGGDPLLIPELIPSYDRTIVEDPTCEKQAMDGCLQQNGPDNKSLRYWNVKPSSDTMLATFRLPDESIKILKNSIVAIWDKENNARLSTFTAVSAWILVCLIKSQKIVDRTIMFLFTADGRGRKRLDPPVPYNYFGNCLLRCRMEAKSKKLVEDNGVAIAAKAITDGVNELDIKISRKDESSNSGLVFAPKGKIYSVGGSPRFELYKVDFGWGRPRKVELISIAISGAFSFCDPRDGMTGVEIGVAMKEHETEDFSALFGQGLGIL